MNFDRLLELARRAAPRIPLVLFSYLNPILAAGADALERAAEAGFSGLLVTDLPVGADPALEARLGEGPLAFIRLVAPTTPTERMKEIAEHGSGFVYLISRLGVTGVQDEFARRAPDNGQASARCDVPSGVRRFWRVEPGACGSGRSYRRRCGRGERDRPRRGRECRAVQ